MGPTFDEALPEKPLHLCEECGKIISAWYTRNRYCNAKCAAFHKRTRIFRCTICLVEFFPLNRNTTVKTCGPECRKVLRAINAEKLRLNKIPEQSVCPICGTVFQTRSSQRRRRLTCSASCRAKYSWRLTDRTLRDDERPRGPNGTYVKRRQET